MAIQTLVLVGLLQLLRPAWLSGDALGWASPFFPGLLLTAAVVAAVRLARGARLATRPRTGPARRPLTDFDPQTQARYQAAGRLEQESRYDEAADEHRRIIEITPDFYLSYVHLAALPAIQETGEAERLCLEAIRIEPLYANAHFYLGLALRKQGRLTDAASAFGLANELGLPKSLRRWAEQSGYTP